MKSYSSREVIQILIQNGWHEVGCDGDHHNFKHPPRKDIPIGTLKSISRLTGIKFS